MILSSLVPGLNMVEAALYVRVLRGEVSPIGMATPQATLQGVPPTPATAAPVATTAGPLGPLLDSMAEFIRNKLEAWVAHVGDKLSADVAAAVRDRLATVEENLRIKPNTFSMKLHYNLLSEGEKHKQLDGIIIDTLRLGRPLSALAEDVRVGADLGARAREKAREKLMSTASNARSGAKRYRLHMPRSPRRQAGR
ncbi:hypothetical protein FOA52_010473 [Chlamydomonas sp. UWO 241]|nr:hypothetical protein FOA52_010473 [Chlamydomonas sp. UWO 241]